MNTTTSSVSIIMPIHNSEQYLKQAIDSVISQTFKNWELFLVIDNSTDNSLKIAQSYATIYSQIHVLINTTDIHSPGSARNYAIPYITGKYTCFLDSDDWIEKKMLYDTIRIAEQTNADIVPFGFFIEQNGNSIRVPLNPTGTFDYNSFTSNAHSMIRGNWSECHELIKSELITNIRHNHLMMGEDICFQMDLLCNAKKIVGLNSEYYHYRVVQNSLSHSWQKTIFRDNLVLWNHEKKFLQYCGIDIRSQSMKNAAIERYIWNIYCVCQPYCPFSFSKKISKIKKVCMKMDIDFYRKDYICISSTFMDKIQKLFIKYHLEPIVILVGSLVLKHRKNNILRN